MSVTVARVATVAVAKARDSKTNGEYKTVTALENTKTVGKPIPVAGVAAVAIATARNSKGEERDIDELVHDSLYVSEHLATATPATPATPCFIESGAVTKTKDSKTGELVPGRLAMVEPMAGAEFQAQLASFRARTNPQAIHLVDILCPAYSGGLKGLTFRVEQLPQLIRALLSVQTQAHERRWLPAPAATAQQPD
jgi:hypothetical protein